MLKFPLHKHLREDEGKVYALGTNLELEPYRLGEALELIYLLCDPKNVDTLTHMIQEDLKHLAEEGFSDKDFEAAKSIILEGHRNELKTNAYWSNLLCNYYLSGEKDIKRPESFEDRLSKITKASVQKLLKEILAQGNSIKVVYAPEK